MIQKSKKLSAFDKWIKKYDESLNHHGFCVEDQEDMFNAWQACKRHILNILYQNQGIIKTSAEDYFGDFEISIIKGEAIKKIKKL
jgi:hypothetical protein